MQTTTIKIDGMTCMGCINSVKKVLEEIASATSLLIDFGGGVQSSEDINAVFSAGAEQITAGSVAIRNPVLLEEWLTIWGSDRIILGADVNGQNIAVGAWEETSEVTWKDFISEKIGIGITHVISTDIMKDGMLKGPSFELYEKMGALFPKLNIIASGGVSSFEDLEKLERLQLHGAIVGKAFYEGRVTLEQLSQINNR